MTLRLEDFTKEQRRTMVKLDPCGGPVPETLSPMHALNLRILARFGLANETERKLTRRGQRLLDEGEVQ